jgi:hypothetical protein
MREMSVNFNSYLTLALDVEMSGQLHAPASINSKETTVTIPI